MLRSIPLFKDLSDADFIVMDDLALEKHVAKGNVVFQRQVVHDDEIGIAQIFEKRYGP